VEFAIKGKNDVMPIIIRTSSNPYRWKIGETPLSRVANIEKKLPRNYITKDGFGITPRCRNYLLPLIKGEDYPPYKNGLPQYIRLRNAAVRRKLKSSFKLR